MTMTSSKWTLLKAVGMKVNKKKLDDLTRTQTQHT